MKTVTIRENQNLFDVCLQNYGSLERLFDLVTDNNLSSITSSLSPKQVLTIDETLVDDEQTVLFYTKNKTIVTTGQTDTDFGDYNDDFNDDFDN